MNIKRRPKRPAWKNVGLVALIDINANLLFFFLLYAGLSDGTLDLPSGIQLPTLQTDSQKEENSFSIAIDMNFIRIAGAAVMPLQNGQADAQYLSPSQDMLWPVFDTLHERFRNSDQPPPTIILHAARDLPYQIVRQVMRSGREVGFRDFRFASAQSSPTKVP